MIKRHELKKMVWIDLFKPTQEEIRELMEEFDIHLAVAEDLLTPTFKPSVDLYDNFIYLILHFPALRHTHANESNQEVDFIIGNDFIITSRYDTIDSIHKLSKVFDMNTALEKESYYQNASDLFFPIITKLYGSIIHELEYIQDSLDRVEEKIFNGEEKKMVKELSNIGRDLLNLKQATNTHQETLESLKTIGGKFFGDNFTHQMKSVVNEHHKIRHNIEVNRESLKELRYTNDSLLTTKQNETMMVLTIMAFVTFPLSLIASIFGMNTQDMPLVGQPHDFWLVLGIMLMLTALMFLFFKSKKWL